MTSRHGSGSGGRRIAPWIIVTLVVAVLLVAGVTAYVLITRDDKDAATCSSQVVLPVVTAPGADAAVEAAAAAFDATKPVARSACVSTAVTTQPGPDTASALAGGWVGQSGPGPALWFPDSAGDLAALEAADSAMTAGRNPAPMAGSPVVLAVRGEDADAVRAANLQWRDLPTATGPTGSVSLPAGRKLILALPDPTANRATSYALQSVLAGITAGPIDPAVVAANAGSLAGLDNGGPAGSPATTLDALDDLAAGPTGFTAVPVVAAEFTQLAAQSPGLTTVTLGGDTAGDQVYGVPLTASWVNPTLDEAASTFLAYLRGPAGQQAFTDQGLKVGADTGVQVVDGGPAVAAALAAAIDVAPGATAPEPTAVPGPTAAPETGATTTASGGQTASQAPTASDTAGPTASSTRSG